MGGADVVPGVSGGTMAFILGIYEELIESIKKFTSADAIAMALKFQIKKAYQTLPWPFLLALGLGILTAIVVLASPIHWMLENRPVLIWAFFFGLVVASIFTVFSRIRKWSPFTVVSLLAGTAAGWIVVGLPLLNNPPDSCLYLAFCGAIAICAMILPGISGSFILLLMGKYALVLNAVNELKSMTNIGQNLLILGTFVVGIIIGISSFVRLLSCLFRKFHDLTVAVLIGFMAGSLRKVWPWKSGLSDDAANVLPAQFNAEFWSAVGLAVAGFLLVMVLETVAKRLEKRAAETIC
ncbi:MAG: DUF368 domain-containing protein [Lentisphaeria bacterium]|nr:DUF368 domain-containing protein [Lentisphaeria bacterium]